MNDNENNWGKWAIDENCYNKILEILPKNKTILEFGSGFGSNELGKIYNIYCVEHDELWYKKYDNINYIYAPLKPINENNDIMWYNINILEKNLTFKYDLILIDGPPSKSSKNHDGRMGLFYNMDMLNMNIPIIVDDVERLVDYKLLINLSKKLKRSYEIFEGGGDIKKKKFGVIL